MGTPIRPLHFFKKHLILLTATSCLLLSSCSHNANYQGKGEAAFQGEWKQDTTSAQKLLVSYSLYDFRFSCDSFYIRINTFSKAHSADSCEKSGHWTEYAKGNYEMHHDTLRLKGFFCLPNWKIKYEDGGCFRYGVYEEGFKISKKTDSVYQLLSTASVNPFNIRLTKRITCTPQPLE